MRCLLRTKKRNNLKSIFFLETFSMIRDSIVWQRKTFFRIRSSRSSQPAKKSKSWASKQIFLLSAVEKFIFHILTCERIRFLIEICHNGCEKQKRASKRLFFIVRLFIYFTSLFAGIDNDLSFEKLTTSLYLKLINPCYNKTQNSNYQLLQLVIRREIKRAKPDINLPSCINNSAPQLTHFPNSKIQDGF